MRDLGDKIHSAILNESTNVEFVNKKGKVVWTFKVGLLSTGEAIKVSEIAYGIQIDEKLDLRAIHKAISTQSDKAITIISLMFKSRSRLPLTLIKFIVKRYTTPDALVELTGLVYDSIKVKSFMDSIILLTGMSLIKEKEIIAFDKEEKASIYGN